MFDINFAVISFFFNLDKMKKSVQLKKMNISEVCIQSISYDISRIFQDPKLQRDKCDDEKKVLSQFSI